MSHESIAAIWTELEKRADLTTILRDAVGQYAMQIALCGKNYSSSESIRAFNGFVNIVRTAFHLQRIYLQPRQPSRNLKLFRIEPSLVIEILVFLLTVKDDYIQDSGLVGEKILRSIGAVLLAGLRLLTLYKSKIMLPPSSLDWASTAGLLKTKLDNWPLGGRVHRTLIGELCISFLRELSTTVEAPLTGGVKRVCELHDDHPGVLDDVDLPDFNDGLYPLKPELRDVVLRAKKCIGCQCPQWFQSFCAWYDIWSALIGASVQLYCKGASDETLGLLEFDFYQQIEDCEGVSNIHRFAAIHETFFALNPFPQCSANGCSCFGYSLQHPYQKLQYPGVWREDSTDAIDIQRHIATDLQRRKCLLRDADGYIQQVAEKTRESVKDWALFPEEDTLELGKLKTYIINCPELHPLTLRSLAQHLDRNGQEDAAKRVQDLEELVPIDGLRCPWCESQNIFTRARLVEPLKVLDQELEKAPRSSPNRQEPSLNIRRSPDRSHRISATSRSLHSSPSRSLLRTIQAPLLTHSRQSSSEEASQGSSRGFRSSIFRSGPSSSRLPVFSVLFTDAKFVLAWTSNRVSCYDCELETWSKGHLFTKITRVAGSSIRYAVVSKEAHTYTLTVFRRDTMLEEKEWSKNFVEQPLSIALPQQGHRVAVGFEKEVQLFDGMTGDLVLLPPALPPRATAGLQIHSQSLSFCHCGNHLVVASRAAGEGKVFIMVHDLQPLQPRDQRMRDLVSTRVAGDFGLSSAVYDHGSSTICICSSAAQENPWLMDRNNPREAIKLTGNRFKPFPGEQIQCAVSVPGIVSQIVMVNHSNKVFILRFENGRWKPYPINVRLENGHGEIVRADEKMSIAAMDGGTVRLFWIHEQDGGMLTIDTNKFDEGHLFQFEKVTTPF